MVSAAVPKTERAGSSPVCATMEQKVDYFDEIKDIAGIIKGFDILQTIDYCKYRREGNNEAAKEMILDKAGEINAIFAEICKKIEKK